MIVRSCWFLMGGFLLMASPLLVTAAPTDVYESRKVVTTEDGGRVEFSYRLLRPAAVAHRFPRCPYCTFSPIRFAIRLRCICEVPAPMVEARASRK